MKDVVRNWLREQVGDDETLVEALYADYCGAMRGYLVQVRRELASGDCASLDRTAHAMKGAVLTAGDTEMLERVLALRDAAKAFDAAAAQVAADRLDALVAQL